MSRWLRWPTITTTALPAVLRVTGVTLVVITALIILSVTHGVAQDRLPRVGVLAEGSADPSRSTASLQLVLDGLGQHGYVSGRNVVVETRFAEGKLERLPDLASELARLPVDVIIAFSERGAVAAHQVTTTVPIVMVLGADPVRRGLIQTMARPGGNVTGLTVDPGPGIIAKRLQVLRDIVPGARAVALLTEPAATGDDTERYRALEETARQSGVSLARFEVRSADELPSAFSAITRGRAGAVLVSGGSALYFARKQVTDLASKHRLPTIYPLRDYAEAGGLVSYGVHLPDLYRRAGGFAGRILKGSQPSDLPVEQPTRFELVVNIKTARALGLTVPASLLQRADHIIE